ncbi:MAG: HIT family protein [Candidatus Roizmanbacteria bacterium]|nr:HIT family protein [Candidatus Roizmanbacteria bacterium]
MFNHTPHNYICPICLGIKGIENEHTLLKKTDLVYRDDSISIFVNSFFIKGNEGHIIIVPNSHYEHIYDLPTPIAHRIIEYAKKYSIMIKKAYNCQGVTLQQNNEPAGDQHAYHFHLHVFPRYTNDSFFKNAKNKINTTHEERAYYVNKLKSSV